MRLVSACLLTLIWLFGASAGAPGWAQPPEPRNLSTSSPEALRRAAFSVLHFFKGGRDGSQPNDLAVDADGNLYGTTYYDGAHAYGGTVFMLQPPGAGRSDWVYRVIYRFQLDSQDGQHPRGTLTIRNGILYGALHSGADPLCGCGAIFKLRPLNRAKTDWKYTIIYRFNDERSGMNPTSAPVFGPDGALYGATAGGGRDFAGTIFKLTGSGDRLWTRTVLHQFRSTNPNSGPQGPLLFHPSGDTIYGTTYAGGANFHGTVFQLKRGAGGAWAHSVIHTFKAPHQEPADGGLPRGGLVFGNDGAIYGTTEQGDDGGSWNGGTIYRLKRAADGKWDYRILHEFIGGEDDGYAPKSGLTMDREGNFYGTTAGGGARSAGVVYKLSRSASGRWGVRVVHSFDHANGGDAPWSQPVLKSGALYGTTLQGGPLTGCGTGCGIVYRLRP